MPGQTPRGIPFPLDGEAPDVPRDVKGAAEATDALIARIYTEQLDPASYQDTTSSRGKLVRRAANGQIGVPIEPDAAGAAVSKGYADRTGLIASASRNQQAGPVSALTEVDGLTIAFNVAGDRYVNLIFDGQATSNEGGTTVGIRIEIAGAKYVTRTVPITTANYGHALHAETRYRLGTGNYTARVLLGRFSPTSGGAYLTDDEASISAIDEGPQ